MNNKDYVDALCWARFKAIQGGFTNMAQAFDDMILQHNNLQVSTTSKESGVPNNAGSEKSGMLACENLEQPHAL